MRSVLGGFGVCLSSRFEWWSAHPVWEMLSVERSVGASVLIGAPADLTYTHNATVKRPAFRGIRAGVGETCGWRPCGSSWFEWLPAYPSSVAPSEARSIGASVEVGAPANLPHNGSKQ